MNTLLKLKEWVYVNQAASCVSIMVGEAVTEADLMQMTLEKRLPLSVFLVNGATARRGRRTSIAEVIAHSKSRLGEAYSDGDDSLIEGVRLNSEEGVLFAGAEEQRIEGVWDLSMKGLEIYKVKELLLASAGAPAVERIGLAGIVLRDEEGMLWELRDRSELGWTFPASTLPDDSVFVMRTSALLELQDRLVGSPSVSPGMASGADKGGLGTQERRTLLRLVYAMAVNKYGYVPAALRNSAIADIASATDAEGVSVSDDTVRKFLTEAATSIAPRKPDSARS